MPTDYPSEVQMYGVSTPLKEWLDHNLLEVRVHPSGSSTFSPLTVSFPHYAATHSHLVYS